MTENQTGFFEAGPIELTSTQRQVIEILKTAKLQKYPLGDWYLGAIYAAKNTYNPDRYSQAAQSLRELLEKLPRVFVESEVQESGSDFRGMRDRLYSRLCSDKNRFEGKWKGKTIDAGLDKTIRGVDCYLKLNQIPTRKEQIHSVMNKLDPMYDTLDQGIRLEKSERFHTLWKTFEGLAHHNTGTDEKFFWEQLALAERLIIELLAPITAQDQGAIQAIISKTRPEQKDFGKLIELIKRRGSNYAFFFKTVDNPAWLTQLVQNGFFKNPPNVEVAKDGRIITPPWWPIFYLQKVSAQLPEQVVEILLSLGQTDHPGILREIFSIACNLQDVNLSLRLKPLIRRFLQSPYRWGEDELIINIIKKWGRVSGPPLVAAQEITQYVVTFQPDPKEEEKHSRHKENPNVWDTTLEPTPRFHEWNYQQILEKGVRPLAENAPYQVARILIDATARMIRLGIHSEELEQRGDEDYSEIWCRRLDKPDRGNHDAKEILVNTLTYACEQVYDKAPESIDALDQALRNQRWKLFKRLRQHLYGLYPNEQTLPWIREFILGYEDYAKQEVRYEFQVMIRKACEHFGPSLLSETEKTGIIDTILRGPSKEDFREWMGDDHYSEKAFQQRRHYFHRMQLRPFAILLSGEDLRYFDGLECGEQQKIITDESYSPWGLVSSGVVTYQSPKSAEELETLTDADLLAYLNNWDEGRRDTDDWLVEVNISALAGIFRAFFKSRIVSDEQRLAFWMEHRDQIERPIYITAMVNAMQELVKEKNFEKLDQWIAFCAWGLSHLDQDRAEGQPGPSDESREYPDWGSPRRAVVDFVRTGLNQDVDVPIAVREGIATLLRDTCTQFDWRLDRDRSVLLNRDDQIFEAINNTRSRALESLIHFAFWVRRQLPEESVPELTDILDERLMEGAEIPLTRSEHALLGMHFGNLYKLNQDWATKNRKLLFPQGNMPVWRDAFESFIKFTSPVRQVFEILQDDFEFALQHLGALPASKDSDEMLADRLGQHLFSYYLWGIYPLVGAESLLAQFYERTQNDRRYWAHLFDHVGRSLKNSGKHLEQGLLDRIIAFFDWRLEAAEPSELQEFTFWLEAECLELEWRLKSYFKVLELVGTQKDGSLYSEVKTMRKLLPDYLSLVVECFAKTTDTMGEGSHLYILEDEAKPILKAGLNAEDQQVRKNAERARENLLRVGRFDFLDVG